MTSSNVTLKQLRYFVAAAETLRFSMAAAQVHVTQSAITTAVLTLERELGVKLFERHPHGVTLTADGHSFYQRAREILDSLDDALRQPRFQVHNLRGAVNIAASYTILGYFLPPLMARFRASYPEIAIDLHDMARAEIQAAIASDQLDLGIVILSNADQLEQLDHHVLVRSRRQLWTAANHPLLDKQPPALADIARYPYIQITVDEGEASTERYWAAQQQQRNVAFRTSSMEGLRGLIGHGFGVTILSDLVYRPWSLEGRKIEASVTLESIPHMEVGLIWKRGKKLDPCSEAFREFLIHACGS
ncbi:LysR family transcriptional regulator [Pseudomaricurvus alcaniphilus]|uniref:LysR family transcriptional regulator n=1 Tax=Pseudomaricurvus alcaniphilus TaxID=1166482 RepID=UPI00140E1275|nr:LysR substrate-binding domain-containing protein [Pseudomaricurvus alcaniphilus]NHN38240.1 LysR family transcriptional regulator [Pseudomaricurvus alcaniphilus]